MKPAIGGHERHHKLAGTPSDIDREAFFWAWERTPKCLDSPLGSGRSGHFASGRIDLLTDPLKLEIYVFIYPTERSKKPILCPFIIYLPLCFASL